jgi:hypothetical protein
MRLTAFVGREDSVSDIWSNPLKKDKVGTGSHVVIMTDLNNDQLEQFYYEVESDRTFLLVCTAFRTRADRDST